MLKTGRNIITRLLPKTGQATEYIIGDDGTYETGWWKGRLNSNNLQRFIPKTIGGDDVVLDRATGLMWAGDGNEMGCYGGNSLIWNLAIGYPDAMLPGFAGFSDWRMPNVRELFSLILFSGIAPFIEQPPFSNTKIERYWTSTTRPGTSTYSYIVNFQYANSSYVLKTEEHYLRCVRKGI